VAKQIILPSRTFPTQASALEYFRSVMYAYEIGETVSDPRHHRLLLELSERHRDAIEKRGPGIKEFFVDRTEAGDYGYVSPKSRGIWIRRIDGSTVDWSYQTAIKKPGPRANLKDALRLAVNDRRVRFRDRKFQSGPVNCELTGAMIPSKDLADVIYRTPSWDELVEGFVATIGGWASVDTNSGYGEVAVGGRLSDPNALVMWLDFWDRHANLLVVLHDEGGRGPRGSD
jgi:Protein of unknown function (DUF3223)